MVTGDEPIRASDLKLIVDTDDSQISGFIQHADFDILPGGYPHEMNQQGSYAQFGVANLKFQLRTSTSILVNPTTPLGVVPEGFRPKEDVIVSNSGGSSIYEKSVTVKATGEVLINDPSPYGVQHSDVRCSYEYDQSCNRKIVTYGKLMQVLDAWGKEQS